MAPEEPGPSSRVRDWCLGGKSRGALSTGELLVLGAGTSWANPEDGRALLPALSEWASRDV